MHAGSGRLLGGCLLLTIATLNGLAADPPTGDKVKVSVVIILASEKDAAVDPKLDDIAREVRKMHPRLKGFRLGPLAARSLAIGSEETFALVEDQKARVVVQRGADKNDRVRLKVAPPQMGEITYSTPCGKFLPIVTPFRTRANELLILAVRVQPCHK